MSHLAKDLVMSHDVAGSMATSARSSVFVEGTGSVLGKIKTVDLKKSVDRPASTLEVPEGTRPGLLGFIGPCAHWSVCPSVCKKKTLLGPSLLKFDGRVSMLEIHDHCYNIYC